MTIEMGPLPSRWDDEADVVVIGSGFAGFAAAAAAASAGSSVIVIEKMAQYGGNSAINLGDYASWDDARHRRIAQGLGDDSAEQHAADALAAGQHYGDPDLVAPMTHEAPAALDWMIAEGGYTCTRRYTARLAAGSACISPIAAATLSRR